MKQALLLFFLLVASAARACPFCNSDTARQIRTYLLGPDMWFNIFITVLPFLIFSAIVYFIYHGGMPKYKRKAATKTYPL